MRDLKQMSMLYLETQSFSHCLIISKVKMAPISFELLFECFQCNHSHIHCFQFDKYT